MFKPECRITPYLLRLFEGVASAGALVRSSRLQASVKAPLEKDAFARSVHSSTWIEGNLLSLAQVRAVVDGKDLLVEEKQKMEVANCLEAMRLVLKNKINLVTEKGLLDVHDRMIKGLLTAERIGKYRRIQNYIVDARNKVIFTPPPPGMVPGRMKSLLAWLKGESLHPIIRSAIFHHEFLTIHPFVDGNGRVARAVGQWLLWERGLDPLCTLGLDDFFAQDRPRYYDLIQQTRDMDGDFTHWVEYVAEGIARSLEDVQDRIKAGTLRLQGVSLTPKQEELLGLLEKKGAMGAAEIGKTMKINRARVNQLISPLVRFGIVIREGAARAVRYRLSEK
ncbi:MAG: Fic family protein [Candidatus Omnitrophica bacterium]|nr:Fic family protein [Candidatus Omnitrophota bacterium]